MPATHLPHYSRQVSLKITVGEDWGQLRVYTTSTAKNGKTG